MSRYVYDMEDEYVYERLRERLSARTLMLFAGAGLSSQAVTAAGQRPPLWPQLLVNMVEWCLNRDLIEGERAKDLLDLIDAGYPEDAGETLQETMSEEELQACLVHTTLCNEARTGDAHRLVVQIPFRAYLTTNYDDFIEGEYYAQSGRRLNKFSNPSLGGLLDAYDSGEQFVAKMHGDISDPRSIVLGGRFYDKLLYADPIYSTRFHIMFGTSSVLFIGFGDNDPNIEAITRRVAALGMKQHPHWILLPRGHVPRARAERLGKDRRLYVIEYERDDDHTGLIRFLRRLAAPSAPGDSVAGDAAATRGIQVRGRHEILG